MRGSAGICRWATAALLASSAPPPLRLAIRSAPYEGHSQSLLLKLCCLQSCFQRQVRVLDSFLNRRSDPDPCGRWKSKGWGRVIDPVHNPEKKRHDGDVRPKGNQQTRDTAGARYPMRGRQAQGQNGKTGKDQAVKNASQTSAKRIALCKFEHALMVRRYNCKLLKRHI